MRNSHLNLYPNDWVVNNVAAVVVAVQAVHTVTALRLEDPVNPVCKLEYKEKFQKSGILKILKEVHKVEN